LAFLQLLRRNPSLARGFKRYETDAIVYWRNVIPTDPNYVDTNMRLQIYQLKLKNRSLQFGLPSYANCP